jgi:chromosome segregation ATPase
MSATQQTFSMKDLACEKVVVFKDRAEIRRIIKTKLKKGENELIINSITNSIDQDSVRVEGLGNATVLDVVCQNKRVELNNSSTNDKIKDLKKELDALESNQEVNRYKLDKLMRQIGVLNEFANTLSKGSSSSSPSSGSNVVQQLNTKESVDNFMSFIDSYSVKYENLSDQKHTLEKEIKNLDEKIQVARDNLNRLAYNNYSESM